MRLRQLTIAAAVLLISTQAFAQEWVEYKNLQDRFAVNFPGQPTVRDFTYTSWLEAKLTYFAWATIDRIVGRQIQLTNPDRSRTFVAIHMLENRLYIFEATVPARAPEPALFQQSPQFLDADGKTVRFPDNYINMYGIPEGSPARQGTQAPRGG